MSKILYISSEAFPLIKTGGLGDVAGSLPAALLQNNQDIKLFLPAYPKVIAGIKNPKVIATTSYYNFSASILESRLPGTNVKVWLLDCPAIFDRPGGPYTDHHGESWHDNALRFSVFCYAAVEISMDKLGLSWKPDVVHCNDWQSGLVPALLNSYENRPATVFTIHNLAYQGVFEKQTFYDLELPPELWNMEALEFYDQLSFIKGGLAFADKINAVSPTYASEILQPAFGYGLDGLLKKRHADLSGILNGIDEKIWNPGTDQYLPHKYNRRSLNKKILNKTALQKELSLPIDNTIPIIGMVSRLVEQKGLEIIIQSLNSLLSMPLQLVILGSGETHYEIELTKWAQQYPEKLKVVIGYDEALAHKIEASSDIYLMPSTFEPCGLNQLYSLRYGTLPVVTAVGGLADTVHDADEENIKNNIANGFILKQQTSSSLINTISYAIALYKKNTVWKQLQVNAMSRDYSWQTSAKHYIDLYQQALKKRSRPD